MSVLAFAMAAAAFTDAAAICPDGNQCSDARFAVLIYAALALPGGWSAIFLIRHPDN